MDINPAEMSLSNADTLYFDRVSNSPTSSEVTPPLPARAEDAAAVVPAVIPGRKCGVAGCDARATHGMLGGKEAFCSEHKIGDMVDVRGRVFQEEEEA